VPSAVGMRSPMKGPMKLTNGGRAVKYILYVQSFLFTEL
jgi:hypothetical protein